MFHLWDSLKNRLFSLQQKMVHNKNTASQIFPKEEHTNMKSFKSSSAIMTYTHYHLPKSGELAARHCHWKLSSQRSFCISFFSVNDLKVMAWWQGFGKGSSKCMFENLLQYVCHIKDTKHIPHKAPTLTYLTVFEYAGTLTWSWKSFVMLNHFSSKSLFMSSPKRLRVEGSASRVWAPGSSEKGSIIQALPGALYAPDQPRAVMYYLAPWKTRMGTSENLPGPDAQLVQSSLPPPVQLSHLHLHQLRMWLLVFNLP